MIPKKYVKCLLSLKSTEQTILGVLSSLFSSFEIISQKKLFCLEKFSHLT
jgi:hypothetical protein